MEEIRKGSNENVDIARQFVELGMFDYSAADGNELTKEDLKADLREKMQKDICGGKTLYQTLRRNKYTLYEVVEEISNITIGETLFNSEFVNEFCEFKNRGLGDTSAFYSEGGLLSVVKFAGNYWDTDRELLDLGDEIVLPKEWLKIHVYEDLERYLLNINGPDKLIDKIAKSWTKGFNDRLFSLFSNIGTCVPAELSVSGNNEAALGDLVDLVKALGGYNDITIAGTQSALRKLTNTVPTGTLSEPQKQSKAMVGNIQYWEGNKLMVIPQTVKSGTFELALNKDQLFILGSDCRPIKVEVFGDSRMHMDTEGKVNADQTVDLQIQTKIGMGLLMPQYFGMFTFA